MTRELGDTATSAQDALKANKTLVETLYATLRDQTPTAIGATAIGARSILAMDRSMFDTKDFLADKKLPRELKMVLDSFCREICTAVVRDHKFSPASLAPIPVGGYGAAAPSYGSHG